MEIERVLVNRILIALNESMEIIEGEAEHIRESNTSVHHDGEWCDEDAQAKYKTYTKLAEEIDSILRAI